MTSYRDPLANALEELAVRRARVSTQLGELRAAHRAVLSEEERGVLANASHAIAAAAPTMEDIERVHHQLDEVERVIERARSALSVDPVAADGPVTMRTVDGVGLWLHHVVAPWNGFVEQQSRRWIARASVAGVDVELEATIVRVGGAIRELRFVTQSQVPPALAAISIERQRTMQSVAKALWLASEKEIGDRAVDDAYWVTGNDDTLSAVVSGEVRACLASLADHAPIFEIARGHARLAWTTRPIDDIDAALFEGLTIGGPRTATEQLVPRATFEIHRAIRAALQPVIVEAEPQIDIEIEVEPGDEAHVVDATWFALVRTALERHVQGDAEAGAQLDALGMRDLALLDDLAASHDVPEVAQLAAKTAGRIRRARDRYASAPALAARFLAESPGDQLRMFVIELLRSDRDTAYVAELMTHLLSGEGQAFARAVSDDRIYDRRAIERGIAALVDHGKSEVAAVLLESSICIDAALAFTSIARSSQQGAGDPWEAALRREIESKLVTGSRDVRSEVVRRFFGDADPKVRSAAIASLLEGPSRRMPAARPLGLSELRTLYVRDPSVRESTMRSIVSLRRGKREAGDPRVEFERALANLGAERPEGYDTTLEDLVFYADAMVPGLERSSDPLLVAALRHPRAGEFADHVIPLLSAAAAETAIEATLQGATTPDGERVVLELLDHRASSNPFPTSLFEDVVARGPTALIRDHAAEALRAQPPDYTSSYY